MKIRSPALNVGDMESDFTTSGVYPIMLDTFWLSLVAIVVNAYSAATSMITHNITLITIVPVFFKIFIFFSPWFFYDF